MNTATVRPTVIATPTFEQAREASAAAKARRVAASEPSIMIRKDQCNEAEEERARVADLEGPDDVLVPGTEEGEGARGSRRKPRLHVCSHHDGPQEAGGPEM